MVAQVTPRASTIQGCSDGSADSRPLQPNHIVPGVSRSRSATVRPPADAPRDLGTGTRLETITMRAIAPPPSFGTIAWPTGSFPPANRSAGNCPTVLPYADRDPPTATPHDCAAPGRC